MSIKNDANQSGISHQNTDDGTVKFFSSNDNSSEPDNSMFQNDIEIKNQALKLISAPKSIEQEINDCSSKIDILECALHAKPDAVTVKSLSSQAETVTSDNSTLQEYIVNLKISHEIKIKELHGSVLRLHSIIGSRNTKIENFKSEKLTTQAEKDYLMTQIQGLQKEVFEVRCELSVARKDISDVRSELSSAQSKIITFDELAEAQANSDLRSELISAQSRIVTLDKDKSAIQEDMVAVLAINKDNHHKIAEFQDSIDQLHSTIKEQQDKFMEYWAEEKRHLVMEIQSDMDSSPIIKDSSPAQSTMIILEKDKSAIQEDMVAILAINKDNHHKITEFQASIDQLHLTITEQQDSFTEYGTTNTEEKKHLVMEIQTVMDQSEELKIVLCELSSAQSAVINLEEDRSAIQEDMVAILAINKDNHHKIAEFQASIDQLHSTIKEQQDSFIEYGTTNAEERRHLMMEIQSVTDQSEKLKKVVEEVTEELSSTKSRANNLQDENSTLRDANDGVRKKLVEVMKMLSPEQLKIIQMNEDKSLLGKTPISDLGEKSMIQEDMVATLPIYKDNHHKNTEFRASIDQLHSTIIEQQDSFMEYNTTNAEEKEHLVMEIHTVTDQSEELKIESGVIAGDLSFAISRANNLQEENSRLRYVTEGVRKELVEVAENFSLAKLKIFEIENEKSILIKSLISDLAKTQEIIKMKSELSSAQSDIITLKKDKSAIQEDMVAILAINKDNHHKIAEFQDSIDQLHSTIKEEQDSFTEYDTTNAEEKRRLVMEIQTVMNQSEELRIQLGKIAGELSSAQSAITYLEEEKSMIQESILAIDEVNQRKIKDFQASIDQLHLTIKEQQDSFIEYDITNAEEKRHLVMEVQAVMNQIEELKKELSKTTGELSTAQSAISNLKEEKSMIQEDMVAILAINKDNRHKIVEFQASIDQLHSTIKEQQESFTEYDTNNADEKRHLVMEIQTIMDQSEELKKELSKTTGKLSTAQSAVMTLEGDKSTIQEDLVDNHHKIAEFQASIDQLHLTIKEQQGSFMEYDITNTEEKRHLVMEIQTVMDQSKELKKELSKTTGELSTAQSAISNLEKDRSAIQEDMVAILAINKDNHHKIAEFQASIDQLHSAIKEQQDSFTEYDINNAEEKRHLVMEIQSVMDQSEELKKELSKTTGELSTAQSAVINLEGDKSAIQEAMVAILAINKGNHHKIAEFQASIDQLHSTIKEQQDSFIEYGTTNTEEKRHLMMEIQTIMDQSEELKKVLEEVTRELFTAQYAVMTLEGDKSAIQEDMVDNHHKITEFQASIDQLHSTIKEQQGSFMEYDITNAEEKRHLVMEIHSVMNQSKELKKALEDVTRELSTAQSAVITLMEDKSVIQEDMVAILAINKGNHHKITEFRASIDQLHLTIKEQQDSFTECDTTNAEEKRHLVWEIEDLRNKLDESTGELTSAKSKANNLQDENSSLQEVNISIKKKLVEVMGILSAARLEFFNIEKEFEEQYKVIIQENSQDQYSIMKQENVLSVFNEKFLKLQERLTDFEICIAEQDVEIANLKAESLKAEEILAIKEIKIKSLMEQFQNLQMDHVEVEGKLSCEQIKTIALETDKSILEKNIEYFKIALTENRLQDPKVEDFQSSLRKLRVNISSSNEKFKTLKSESEKHDLMMKEEIKEVTSKSDLIVIQSQDLRVELAKVTREFSLLQMKFSRLEEEKLRLLDMISLKKESKIKNKLEQSQKPTFRNWIMKLN